MKKSIARVVLAASLAGCMMLFGCSSGGSSVENEKTSDPTPPEPAQQQEQADSKYAVTIDDCQVTSDYSGKPAIVVTYTFANNSEKATSFVVAISAKCFQNGVQLDSAIVNDIDSQSTMNEIKPGTTTTVQWAYLLDDQSDVSVECTELISFSDAVLAEKTFSVAQA
ncbi:DUF5067 domain-containing protein [Gordonibacter sp.]|uniref:DUF5067 domain-containing protein n=1 Tax=Gordonibacter sp. TaxID=1968902 RepID=UPI0025C0EE86|nr:DUF5067 domain-containing protein [Gordonibacter sp.]